LISIRPPHPFTTSGRTDEQPHPSRRSWWTSQSQSHESGRCPEKLKT
jgi:hypothetical protein